MQVLENNRGNAGIVSDRAVTVRDSNQGHKLACLR
jgi:hypothetical protein